MHTTSRNQRRTKAKIRLVAQQMRGTDPAGTTLSELLPRSPTWRTIEELRAEAIAAGVTPTKLTLGRDDWISLAAVYSRLGMELPDIIFGMKVELRDAPGVRIE